MYPLYYPFKEKPIEDLDYQLKSRIKGQHNALSHFLNLWINKKKKNQNISPLNYNKTTNNFPLNKNNSNNEITYHDLELKLKNFFEKYELPEKEIINQSNKQYINDLEEFQKCFKKEEKFWVPLKNISGNRKTQLISFHNSKQNKKNPIEMNLNPENTHKILKNKKKYYNKKNQINQYEQFLNGLLEKEAILEKKLKQKMFSSNSQEKIYCKKHNNSNHLTVMDVPINFIPEQKQKKAISFISKNYNEKKNPINENYKEKLKTVKQIILNQEKKPKTFYLKSNKEKILSKTFNKNEQNKFKQNVIDQAIKTSGSEDFGAWKNYPD